MYSRMRGLKMHSVNSEPETGGDAGLR
jgi:hypothetical protein